MTLIIKKIGDKRGVFTDRPFEANDVVLKFQGINLTSEEVAKLTPEQQGNVLQIGTNQFLDLQKETAFFCNHHCNPNCYVKAVMNTAFLIATRPVAKGDEITFDYSLTSTDTEEIWAMKCECHRFYCRRNISGFRTLPEKEQNEMLKKGIVPRYISKV